MSTVLLLCLDIELQADSVLFSIARSLEKDKALNIRLQPRLDPLETIGFFIHDLFLKFASDSLLMLLISSVRRVS